MSSFLLANILLGSRVLYKAHEMLIDSNSKWVTESVNSTLNSESRTEDSGKELPTCNN